MPYIETPQLKDLLYQAKFAPERKRLEQIDACEAIIRLIKPGCNYPFEFICFHLTGYRRHTGKGFDPDNTLDYKGLLADIPAYANQLSKTLNIPSSSVQQKVYTIQSLTRRFRVCSKTICRWRKKGLVGRYLIFPDGRKRLAFLATSVERFVRQNRHKVLQSKNFSQINGRQREEIIHRLERWSRRCPNHRQEAIRRTARRYNRSQESIRTFVIQAEQDGCAKIQFERRPYAIEPELRRRIYELYQQDVPVKKIMNRFGRSKSNIYRAVNLEAVERRVKNKINYIESEEFNTNGDKNYILNPPPELFPKKENLQKNKKGKFKQEKVLEPISTYVRDISHTELLNPREEQFLFRQYNYLKHLASRIQQKIDGNHPSARQINQLRLYLRQAREVKDLLLRSNLRLVVSTARRHNRNDCEMPELISEGNMALINAVEKFNYALKVKFSTYATWAIVKRYATMRYEMSRNAAHDLDNELLEVVSDMRMGQSKIISIESARKSLEQVMRENLEDRERIVVREHFGLIKQTEISGQRRAKSLRQIAQVLRLSKERVRQIELYALQKLRRVLTREQFDLLTQG